jgi:uncharacterized protein (TIGR03435 family)
MRVSHETIYRSLFIQARGVLKKELIQHLRSKRCIRRSRHSQAGGQSRGQIVDAISIRERSAEIEDRTIPGHWEGDLLGGASNSHIATLVERHSRFTMLVKVPSKDTAAVVAALSMADFATWFQGSVTDKPVVYHTGLTDRYDFTLKWTPDDSQFVQFRGSSPLPPPRDDAPPSLYTAAPEQLGLKFESTKAPDDVIVIDHVEKPSPN